MGLTTGSESAALTHGGTSPYYGEQQHDHHGIFFVLNEPH